MLGVLLNPSKVTIQDLQPSVDSSLTGGGKGKGKGKKESVNLDSCMKAFSMQELLTGDIQWYCSSCKEHRDILKKLEIYRLPKIMII